MAATWAQGSGVGKLRGVDSMGVIRIPRYVDLHEEEGHKSRPALKVGRREGRGRDRGGTGCGRARASWQEPGEDEAIGCAKAVHIGWCAAQRDPLRAPWGISR